jgi:alpha-1,3-fucosyltransferase
LKIVQNKTKTAAWAVSNCFASSKREILVNQLWQYIDIDIYGGCGNLTCENCEEFFEQNYKFYLAFENSLYADYITEKLYKVLNRNIIPIVFNGANMSQVLPPKSYIDANDFKTPEDLAKHIKFLSDNPAEYVKYFWWKKHYRADTQPLFTLRHVCKICEKLNEPNLEFKRQSYASIKEWFTRNAFKNATIKY